MGRNITILLVSDEAGEKLVSNGDRRQTQVM